MNVLMYRYPKYHVIKSDDPILGAGERVIPYPPTRGLSH